MGDPEAVFSRVRFTVGNRVQREKLWGYYHTVRSLVSFRQKWIGVLESIIPGCTPSPIFFQYVTDKIFLQLLKIHLPLTTVQPVHQQSCELTYEEASGLHYAAGYVCRALKKFVDNAVMIECIDELVDHDCENRLTARASGHNWQAKRISACKGLYTHVHI